MNWKPLAAVVLLTLAACGGSDEPEPAAEGDCLAALEIVDVAIQAWYASGNTEHPDEQMLIDETFLDPAMPGPGYVEVDQGEGAFQSTTDRGELCR